MDMLLIVDDDIDSCVLLGAILEGQYQLHYCMNGEQAQEFLQHYQPALILLDIALPGLSGYDLCRQIRLSPKTEHIPVLFLSGHQRMEDRLMAYEVGGNDFIGKPFFNQELERSISHIISSQQESANLRAQLDTTRSMAMKAMSNLGELGSLLSFLHDGFRTDNYASLARALLAFCQHSELDASVRICGSEDDFFLSTNGLASPVARSVFDDIDPLDLRRNWQVGRTEVVHCASITLLLPGFAEQCGERAERLREHLLLAVEAAAARVDALDAASASSRQYRQLCQLAQQAESALKTVDNLQQQQRLMATTILGEMLTEMEQAMARLQLSKEQENIVSLSMHTAVDRVFKLYDQGLAIEEHLRNVRAALGAVHS